MRRNKKTLEDLLALNQLNIQDKFLKFKSI